MVFGQSRSSKNGLTVETFPFAGFDFLNPLRESMRAAISFLAVFAFSIVVIYFDRVFLSIFTLHFENGLRVALFPFLVTFNGISRFFSPILSDPLALVSILFYPILFTILAAFFIVCSSLFWRPFGTILLHVQSTSNWVFERHVTILA